jgi:diguanylate cyclase (GGDEF)-like protein
MGAFLLISELLAITALLYEAANARPPAVTDWARLGILAACATVHIQVTRRQEEWRRNHPVAVHIDLSGIWVFPAALLLPIPLALIVLAVVRGQRWLMSRRPPHKFLFTSLIHASAALCANRLFAVLVPDGLSGLTPQQAMPAFGGIVVVGLAYALVQAVLIATLLVLGGSSQPTVRNVLGSKEDNLLEVSTIGLGVVAAVLLVNIPPATAILVLVAVVGNRLAELTQLQADARTDPKTGVLNVRGFAEPASRALARAARAGEQVALAIVDLDHFKSINDSYGHPAGDDVLRTVAQGIGEAVRPTDTVGRFGGEEFMVLLPDTGVDASLLIADRIRSTIGGLSTATTDKRGGPTHVSGRTASVGVAVFPAHGDTAELLMQAADAALYEAKEAGRNRIRLAAPAHGAGTPG